MTTGEFAEQKVGDQPPFEVKWNDSVARVENLDAILTAAREGVVSIYDRADFETPIERAEMTARVVTSNGETGVAYEAVISLDRSRHNVEALLPRLKQKTNNRPVFVPYGNVEKDLRIEETVFKNVFRVSDKSGSKSLVWLDEKMNRVGISNSLSLSAKNDDGSERRVSIEPPAEHTVDQQAVLGSFLKNFMRTMDYVAGTTYGEGSTYYNPLIPMPMQPKPLKRHYPIGRELVDVSGSARTLHTASKAGKQAVSGTQKQQKGAEKQLASGKHDHIMEELGLEKLRTDITLDEVGGLARVKSMIREVATSFNHPEIMEQWGASRPKGVLFYGPPGTGKTLLTRALGNAIGADVWQIQATDIYNKWLGDSSKKLKAIFTAAREYPGRVVLFFDEFDSIVGIEDGGSGASAERNAVAGLFKQELNTLVEDNPGLLLVGATNFLENIDPSLTRSGRFDRKIFVPMPDLGARKEIVGAELQRLLKAANGRADFEPLDADFDTDAVAEATDAMSGADITEIFSRIKLEKAMEHARAMEIGDILGGSRIKTEDVLRTIDAFRANG